MSSEGTTSAVFTAFRNSSAWDHTHSLPLCPGNNNPWIYGAYAMKVMRANGLAPFEELRLHRAWSEYADKCRIKPGLFNRRPVGSTWTSHDELMGIAYVLPEIAPEVIRYLDERGGVYTNLDVDAAAPDAFVRFNVYRFPFVSPFLRAAAGWYVNPVSQAIYAAHILNDIRVTKPGLATDAGGRLRIWLMLEAMDRFWISGLANWAWKNRMNALGYSPQNQLKIEPGEHSVFAQYAPGSF